MFNPALQHILAKSLIDLIGENSHLLLDIYEEEQDPAHAASPLDICNTILAQGLNINLWIKFDLYGQSMKLPLIEKIFSDCSNFDILQTVAQKIEPKFLLSLSYEKQCDIVESILEKNFSDIQKHKLLEIFYNKGFKVTQKNIYNSRELDWIEAGHKTIFDIIWEKQSDFKWTYVYKSEYDQKEQTLMSKLDDSLLNLSEQIDSQLKLKDQMVLIDIKDIFEKVFQHENLTNKLKEKSNDISVKNKI